MKSSAVWIGLAALLGSAAYAPAKTVHPKKITPKESLICPITGDKVLPQLKAKSTHSTYKGVTYYFCCPPCKPQFDKNSTFYLSKKPGATLPHPTTLLKR